MQNTVNERIKILITRYAKGENNTFAKETGIPESTLSSIIGTRQTKPTYKVISKIANRYDNVNLNWLVKGIGNIENNVSDDVPPTDSGNFKTQLKDAVKEAIGELIHNGANTIQEGKKMLDKGGAGATKAS